LAGPNALAVAPLDSGGRTVTALDDIAAIALERLDVKPLPLSH
jgi:hypothetical protein